MNLVTKSAGLYEKADAATRVLIAIAGLPGSGKTTLASTVVRKLNERHHKELGPGHPSLADYTSYDPATIAQVVPLDGFHLTRAQLAAMPDPEEAAYRRGAPFTFDADKYHRLVKQLRDRILPETSTIYAPSFDHAKKDPVEDDISILRSARVVVFEGLYVAMDEKPWSDAAELMDEIWFVDVPFDVGVERLVVRNFAAGLSPSAEHARTRVMKSDMPNGQYAVDRQLPVQETIRSLEDGSWNITETKESNEAKSEAAPPDRAGSIAELAAEGGGC